MARRSMPLMGARDAWGLAGLSAGLAAASPWLAGLGIGQTILTIGPRVYHLDLPRILTPIDLEVEGDDRKPDLVFAPCKRPTRIPADEQGANLEGRLAEFMSS